MELEKRRRYYNACKVDEPLNPDDPRNVDIDQLEGMVRGDNWVDRLANNIILSSEPSFQLFSGLRGSGKSTELRRLRYRLNRSSVSPMLTVLINAEEVLDLSACLDHTELLASVVNGIEREVLTLEGKDPNQALQDGYLTRLWSWLTRTNVELGSGELSIPGGLDLLVELKTRPTLRQRLRQTVAQHLSTFLLQVRQEVRELEERAKRCGFTGIFVIVDSLEKLRGSGESFEDVLKSAEHVFSHGAPYLRLPVHTLYTVPPALYTRLRNEIVFMPVLKVRDAKTNAPDPVGMAALRRLVRHCIPDEDLQALLGPDCEGRLEEIFRLSGGYPRELVQLLRQLLSKSSFPVSEREFQMVLRELKTSYRMVTPASAFSWLAQVDQEHFLTIQDSAHTPIADAVLSNNGVLHYYNGEPWWGLHPAVRAIPGVEAAIEALQP